jgi:transcriptional regulator with XRE-family HTH domain
MENFSDKKQYGLALRRRREACGLSRVELARALRLSSRTIKQAELGIQSLGGSSRERAEEFFAQSVQRKGKAEATTMYRLEPDHQEERVDAVVAETCRILKDPGLMAGVKALADEAGGEEAVIAMLIRQRLRASGPNQAK